MKGAEGFKQSFQEEAREIVADLEACLLELNENRGDAELIGRAFRALHTIKGSGSMFGFDRLARFTHNLETAFDQVRRGRIAVTPELVDITLAALDQIRAMIEDEAGGAADSSVCSAILGKVCALAGAENEKPPQESTARSAAPPRGAPAGDLFTERLWRIRFVPGPEMMQNGADPLALVREVGQLGRLSVMARTENIPALQEIQPERCYVGWEMTLATSAGVNAIRDVFIFVEDSCKLEIEAASEESGSAAGAGAGELGGTAAERNPLPAATDCAADRTARALEEQRRSPGRRSYDQPENATSLRVPAARLDQLVDLVGELVTVQARLSELAARSDNAEVLAVAEEIERLTSAMRETSMNLRMLPIRATFERFRRLVHDLARDLGKDVELTIEGADTEMDKTVIDQLSDPLMHLVRNSMDHGIESPEQRAATGKPRSATIHLSARHSGANVLIAISDDGGGIDTEAVRAKAIERGLVSADVSLTESEIFAFIFGAGFSTARQVTNLSGRGVGMDVVRQRVESLRGSIDVTSRRGAGTTVTLRLPLTLAIIDGLLVSVGPAFFVLPLASTLECIELTREEAEASAGRQIAIVRGAMVPYIGLRQYFRIGTPPPERQQIMVVESEQGRCGLLVDQVHGDCQTVIRNLGRLYRHVQVVSGATILGNGTVALILDPQRLVQEAVRSQSNRERAGGWFSENRHARDGTSAALRSGADACAN